MSNGIAACNLPGNGSGQAFEVLEVGDEVEFLSHAHLRFLEMGPNGTLLGGPKNGTESAARWTAVNISSVGVARGPQKAPTASPVNNTTKDNIIKLVHRDENFSFPKTKKFLKILAISFAVYLALLTFWVCCLPAPRPPLKVLDAEKEEREEEKAEKKEEKTEEKKTEENA